VKIVKNAARETTVPTRGRACCQCALARDQSPVLAVIMKLTLRRVLLFAGLPLVLVWMHLAVSPEALAARFLHVQIEHDGAVILESGFGAGDEEDRERLWGLLKDVKLVEVGSSLLANEGHQLVLQGDIRITIRHVDRELVSVQVDKLLLHRAVAGNRTWHLPREEIERTAIQGGLDVARLYPPERSRWGVVMAVAAVAGGGLIALAIWLSTFWILRRVGGRQPKTT